MTPDERDDFDPLEAAFLCLDESPFGYLCTRELDHPGIHEAVGSDDQALDRWA